MQLFKKTEKYYERKIQKRKLKRKNHLKYIKKLMKFHLTHI